MHLNVAKKVYWSCLDLLKLYRTEGVAGLRDRYANREPMDLFLKLTPILKGKRGLEIGGPSPMFARGKALPIYAIVRCVDNCNFSQDTFWQGQVPEGRSFRFDWRKSRGHQYILDAANLDRIPPGRYDFVLSSHNIEHIANPIAALSEWLRVLRNDGYLVLIVPHKDGTFDHRRPVTSLTHLIEDYVNQTKEDDRTHLEEILDRHDLDRDASVTSFEEFREVAMQNAIQRRLHHHVFDTRLVVQLLDYVGLQICHIVATKPFHIIAVARRLAEPNTKNNCDFLAPHAEFRYGSPFPSDRLSKSPGYLE